MMDETQFPFLSEKGHIVSFVGGGGKTTLMYAMAAHCARKGWRALALTTTHIMQPPGGLWAQTEAARDALWRQGSYAVAGTAAAESKLTIPPPHQLETWFPLADAVFVEADGAKRMPCKVPAVHEPVLLPQSDILVAVAGASALGRPLKEVCFRLELATTLLHTAPDSLLTPELLAELLTSSQGGRKYVEERQFYAVLNQADTPECIALARQTAAILQKEYQVPCILTHFEEGERA